MSGEENSGILPSAKRVSTPLSLARLMDAGTDPEGNRFGEEEQAALVGLMRQSLFHDLHAELFATAIVARVPRLEGDFLADAAESAEQLDRLLAARGWQEPAAALGEETIDCEQLLLILKARQRRGAGDPEILRLVERRLRKALEAEADERSGRSTRRAASASECVSSRSSDSLPTGPAGLPAQTCRPGSFSGKGRGAS